jgi:hypothetical protein
MRQNPLSSKESYVPKPNAGLSHLSRTLDSGALSELFCVSCKNVDVL